MKTLNDMDEEMIRLIGGNWIAFGERIKKELRDNALLWVEECRKHNITNKEYQQGQIDWINNFFNLKYCENVK